MKVAAADVTLIAQEMDITEQEAEARLREHGGDALAALRSFLAV